MSNCVIFPCTLDIILVTTQLAKMTMYLINFNLTELFTCVV